MKKYLIKHLDCRLSEVDWEDIEKAEILCTPWLAFPKCFYSYGQLAELPDSIAVKLFSREEEVRCVNYDDNSPVNQDSCLEFFPMPFEDGPYYNFEINPNGCLKVKVGPDKINRNFIELDEPFSSFFNISAVRESSFWSVTYEIPKSFLFADAGTLPKSFRGNFFKCGDLTDHPHYQCWNEIFFPERPNFHLPEFFGVFEFESVQPI